MAYKSAFFIIFSPEDNRFCSILNLFTIMSTVKVASSKQKVAVLNKEGYVSRVKTYSTLTGDEFIELAALNSGINESQLSAAMAAIKQQFQNFLVRGYAVTIPGVGIFRLGVNAKMVDKEEDVSAKQIYRRKIIFCANTKLKSILDQISFSTSGEETDAIDNDEAGDDSHNTNPINTGGDDNGGGF